jgi:acyl-coenzyme A thioesterase PaaI-like protein
LQEELLEESNRVDELVEKNELITHSDILHNHAYKLLTLKENYAKIEISTLRLERIDKGGFIYSGEIFNGASFCAVAAINRVDYTLISSNTDFLNPIKEDGIITFEADVVVSTNAKKIVRVKGDLEGIEFFEGEFHFIKMDDIS